MDTVLRRAEVTEGKTELFQFFNPKFKHMLAHNINTLLQEAEDVHSLARIYSGRDTRDRGL